MSRRVEPCRKKPLEILDDVLAGAAEAAYAGPKQIVKYLNRVREENKSLPNATKFFIFDLLADAHLQCGAPGEAQDYAAQAREYLSHAQEDAPRHLKEYFGRIRAYEVGISVAVDEGRFEEALAICEAAVALGLGKVYESKAHSIRRML